MHECEASAQSPLKDMWRSLLEKDLILAEPLTVPQELATRSKVCCPGSPTFPVAQNTRGG